MPVMLPIGVPTRILALCGLLLLAGPATRVAAQPASIEGDWSGALRIGPTMLTLILHLTRTGDDWAGQMDSVDQGAMGIPIDLITFDGKTLHFAITAIGGSYDGHLTADGDSLAGRWQQSGVALPLDFARVTDASSLLPNRPQEPKPPLPYDVEEVVYPNPAAGITLAGTLSLPHTPGPHPAVLMITGSGPQDRDEFVMGHRPFLVLGDHLVRAGIAVLRVDDRGVGKSTGSFADATVVDFASDALAGVEFLKARREVDARRIGLLGHSEGGMVGPMVAVESEDVAFMVLMAGVGVKADELLSLQSALIMRAQGASESMIAANHEAITSMFKIVQEDADPASADARLREVAADLERKLAAIDPAIAESSTASIEASVAMVNSPWFRNLLSLDPAATLRRVTVPVLAINGSLDLQVDPAQNLRAIENALREGGNPDATVKELAGLNHLFQTAKSGSPSEYSTIEETMSPAAMMTVSDWILARTRRSKQ